MNNILVMFEDFDSVDPRQLAGLESKLRGPEQLAAGFYCQPYAIPLKQGTKMDKEAQYKNIVARLRQQAQESLQQAMNVVNDIDLDTNENIEIMFRNASNLAGQATKELGHASGLAYYHERIIKDQ